MSIDDDRFPPITHPAEPPPADVAPLDLSVLARAQRQEETPQNSQEQKPRDRPPRARTQRDTRQDATGRQQGTRGRPRAVPVPDSDDIKIEEYHPGILVKPLRDLYVTVGTLVIPFNKTVGTAFIQNAEPCAKALDNAAKADKQIRRVLMLLVQGSVWGEVIIAHMPIMMALAVTMVPSVRASFNGVQSEGGDEETINPVSNGYTR